VVPLPEGWSAPGRASHGAWSTSGLGRFKGPAGIVQARGLRGLLTLVGAPPHRSPRVVVRWGEASPGVRADLRLLFSMQRRPYAPAGGVRALGMQPLLVRSLRAVESRRLAAQPPALYLFPVAEVSPARDALAVMAP
jgi:hypothetical protein